MALKVNEIEDLLRGDLSDIDEFSDVGDYDEETTIMQRIMEINKFIDNNNAEIYDLVIYI